MNEQRDQKSGNVVVIILVVALLLSVPCTAGVFFVGGMVFWKASAPQPVQDAPLLKLPDVDSKAKGKADETPE